MAGQFVFRQPDDTENPALARLYGLGITRGRDVLYDETGARILTVISEGARRDGDTHCGNIILVTYRGYIIPEFESGIRNWRYHDGRMTKIPVYTTVTADNTTNKLTKAGHGLANSAAGETYKIIAEGPASPTKPSVPAGLIHETQAYYIVNSAANDFQLSLTLGGAAVDFTDNGNGTLRVYRANAGFDDPDQGRPEFWPEYDFTLSGVSYVEQKIPTRYATNFSPDDMRFVVRGKQLRNFTYAADEIVVLDAVGAATDSTNPSLELLDFFIGDANMPPTFDHLGITVPRYRASTFAAYRTRSDALIDWAEGGIVEGIMAFASHANFTLNAENSGLTKTTADAFDALAVSAVIPTTVNDTVLDATVIKGTLQVGYKDDTNVANAPVYAIEARSDGNLYWVHGATTSASLGAWAIGDRIKVTIENRVFRAYQNEVLLSAATATPASAVNYYASIRGYSVNSQIALTQFSPLNLSATPRQVKRFTSHVVYPTPTLVQDAVSGILNRTPGVQMQDVNGGIKLLTDSARAIAFTFQFNPAGVTNILPDGCKMSRTSYESRLNFYRAIIRDSDTAYLTQVPIFEDRPKLRAKANVGLLDSGLLTYGVMNQSEATRIIKAQARLASDLVIFSEINATFESYVAAKGDFVIIADDVPGYTISDAVLFIVTDENCTFDTVPTRAFNLQIITRDYYSDTDVGVAIPVIPVISL